MQDDSRGPAAERHVGGHETGRFDRRVARDQPGARKRLAGPVRMFEIDGTVARDETDCCLNDGRTFVVDHDNGRSRAATNAAKTIASPTCTTGKRSAPKSAVLSTRVRA